MLCHYGGLFTSDNVAHKYSDEYQYASTTDKEAVLAIAHKCHIDGILTFTDSGVLTAGYVANMMGLPSPGPYESIQILQNKGRFRQFLAEHDFNVPQAKSYTEIEVALSEGNDWRIPQSKKPHIESNLFFWRYAYRFAQRCVRYAKRHFWKKE